MSVRVAVTKGSLRIPPTYFAIQHALLLHGRADIRFFVGAAEIADEVNLGNLGVTDTSASFGPLSKLSVDQRERLSLLFTRHTARNITAWRPEIIHQHVAYSSLAAIRASQQTSVPLLLTVHGGDAFTLLRDGVGLPLAHRASLARMKRDVAASFAAADQILAVSEYLAKVLVTAGAPGERVVVHRQGVDTGLFVTAQREPRSRPRMLFVGRMTEAKGVLDLIEAVRGMDLELRFIGAGPLEQKVRALSQEDDRIVVRGAQPMDVVREEMQQADVLVLPTKDNNGAKEAAGLVLLEAQASGTPVVAYDSGGTSEMLRDGHTGFLAPEGDVSALRERLEHVAALGSSALVQLGRAGREFVVQERSAQGAADELLSKYRSAAS